MVSSTPESSGTLRAGDIQAQTSAKRRNQPCDDRVEDVRAEGLSGRMSHRRDTLGGGDETEKNQVLLEEVARGDLKTGQVPGHGAFQVAARVWVLQWEEWP